MHIGFDLDGVLLDSESDLSWLQRSLSKTLASLEIPNTRENRDKLFPATNPEFITVAAEAGITPDELWSIRDSHYRESKLTAIQTGELSAFPDVEWLQNISKHDLHIISNSPSEIVEAFVTTNDLSELISARIGRGTSFEDLDRLKPQPYFYTELLDQTNDPTAPYVYVGHTETDAQFAEQTGMTYVHFDRETGVALSDLSDLLPGILD